jgi:hypothetical protein
MKLRILKVKHSLKHMPKHIRAKASSLASLQKSRAGRFVLVSLIAVLFLGGILVGKKLFASPPSVEKFEEYNTDDENTDFGDGVLTDASGNTTYLTLSVANYQIKKFDKEGNASFAHVNAYPNDNQIVSSSNYPTGHSTDSASTSASGSDFSSGDLIIDGFNNDVVEFVTYESGSEVVGGVTYSENLSGYSGALTKLCDATSGVQRLEIWYLDPTSYRAPANGESLSFDTSMTGSVDDVHILYVSVKNGNVDVAATISSCSSGNSIHPQVNTDGSYDFHYGVGVARSNDDSDNTTLNYQGGGDFYQQPANNSSDLSGYAKDLHNGTNQYFWDLDNSQDWVAGAIVYEDISLTGQIVRESYDGVNADGPTSSVNFSPSLTSGSHVGRLLALNIGYYTTGGSSVSAIHSTEGIYDSNNYSDVLQSCIASGSNLHHEVWYIKEPANNGTVTVDFSGSVSDVIVNAAYYSDVNLSDTEYDSNCLSGNDDAPTVQLNTAGGGVMFAGVYINDPTDAYNFTGSPNSSFIFDQQTFNHGTDMVSNDKTGIFYDFTTISWEEYGHGSTEYVTGAVSLKPYHPSPTGTNGAPYRISDGKGVFKQDSSGNYYIAANTDIDVGARAFFVQKLNSAGVLQWTYMDSFEDSNTVENTIYDLEINSNGKVYLAVDYTVSGQKAGKIIKLNQNGGVDSIGSFDSGYGLDTGIRDIMLANNSVFGCGYVRVDNSTNFNDFYIGKTAQEDPSVTGTGYLWGTNGADVPESCESVVQNDTFLSAAGYINTADAEATGISNFTVNIAQSTLSNFNGWEDFYGTEVDASGLSQADTDKLMVKDAMILEDNETAWILSFNPTSGSQLYEIQRVNDEDVTELTSDTYVQSGYARPYINSYKAYTNSANNDSFAMVGYDVDGERGFIGIVEKANIGSGMPDQSRAVGNTATNSRVTSLAISQNTAYIAGYDDDTATGNADSYVGRFGWSILSVSSANVACLKAEPFDLTTHQWMGGDYFDVDIRTTTGCGSGLGTEPTIGSTTDNSTDTSGSSLVTSHTVPSGSNRFLALEVSYSGTSTVDTITFGAQDLTHACTAAGDTRYAEIWYLVAPSTGTQDVTVTWNGSVDGKIIGITNFTGVDQTTPIGAQSCTFNDAFTGDFGTFTDAQATISSNTDQIVFGGVMAYNDTITFTPQAGETQLWQTNTSGGNSIGAGAYMDGVSPSVSFGFDRDRDWPWALAVVSIKGITASQGTKIAEVRTEFPEDDISSTTIDGETGTLKSWFDGSLAISNWKLIIPKSGGNNTVRVCPGVTSLAEIDVACSGEIILPGTDPDLTDNGSTWTLANLTAGSGYGAQSYTSASTVDITEFPFISYDSGSSETTVLAKSLNGHIIYASGNDMGEIRVSSVRVYDNTTQWSKTFAHPSNDLRFFLKNIELDADGNIFIGADEAITDTINNHDFFVAKFDFGGNILWYKSYDGGSRVHDSFDPLNNLAIDSAGNPVVAGIMEVVTETDPFWKQVMATVKIDGANGNEIWRHIEDLTPYHSYANDVTVDSSDNIYVCGGADVELGSGTHQRDLVAVKYDGTDGHKIWTYEKITTNPDFALEQCDVEKLVPSENNLVIGGQIKSDTLDTGEVDLYVAGIDMTTGLASWERTITNGTVDVGASEYFEGIAYNVANNTVLVTGRSDYHAGLADALAYAIDANDGHIVWQSSLDNGGEEAFRDAKTYTDFLGNTHYIVAGFTDITGNRRGIVRSYATNGAIEYTKLLNQGGATRFRKVAIDSRGIVYTAGVVTISGQDDAFIEKYGFKVDNVPSGTTLVADIAPGVTVDLASAGYGGAFSASIIDNMTGNPIAQFNMGLVTDIDWTSVEAIRDGFKTLVHFPSGFASTPGVQSSTYSLLVERPANSQSVVICPGATAIVDVEITCSGAETKLITDVDVDIVAYNGKEFFKVSGLSSTGGLPINDASAVRDIMTREQVSVASDHTIEFGTTLGINSSGDTIAVDFDDAWDFTPVTVSDIDLQDNGTDKTLCTGSLPCSPGAGVWGVDLNTSTNVLTFTAPTDAASGEVNINDTLTVKIGKTATFQAAGTNQPVNPAVVASYEIHLNITNGGSEYGEMEVPIIDDDTVNITGYLDTFVTFDIDTATSDVNCDAVGGGNPCDSYGGATDNSGYVVDLGEMSTSTVNVSGNSAAHADGGTGNINSIWFDISSNAANGINVRSYSLNDALLGPGASTIPSVGSGEVQITAGSSLYGLQNRFLDSKSSVAGTIDINSDCDTTGGDTYFCSVGGSSGRTIFSSTGRIDTGRVQFRVGATPNSLNATGTYTDQLTFIASASF